MFHASNLDLHHHLLSLAEAMRPLPMTVCRLAALIADEHSQMADVVTILRDDPSLVAALLRQSNSAASAPATEIVTVEAAIVRLGLARVLAIATHTAIGTQPQEALAAYDLPPGQLWDHSIRVSYVAEAIYRRSPKKVGPEVVTAALLHDIGQIVLDKVLDPLHFHLARDHHVLVTTAERELVEVDHAELGAMLLELWEIPSSISNAVRYHHEPATDVDFPAHVVRAANLLSHVLDDELGQVGEDLDRAADPSTDRAEERAQDEQQLQRSLQLLEVERDDIVARAIDLLRKAGLLPEHFDVH
jgi:putative nucleotidyltransferase with HDIG domain